MITSGSKIHARLLSISIDGFHDLCCIYIVSLVCRQGWRRRERERERVLSGQSGLV
ncbi:MAG: hypothetical protein MJE68_23945 [Proteobacteria bacterium]|nr:hypothetical protein [Pseudomonadota bacterium]